MIYKELWQAVKHYEAAAIYQQEMPYPSLDVLQNILGECRELIINSLEHEFKAVHETVEDKLQRTKGMPYSVTDISVVFEEYGDIFDILTDGDMANMYSRLPVSMLVMTESHKSVRKENKRLFVQDCSDFYADREEFMHDVTSVEYQQFLNNLKDISGYESKVFISFEQLAGKNDMFTLLFMPETIMIRDSDGILLFCTLSMVEDTIRIFTDDYVVL